MKDEEKKKDSTKGQVGGIASVPPDFKPYLYYHEISPSQFQVYVLINLPAGWRVYQPTSGNLPPSQSGFYTTTKNRYVVEVEPAAGPASMAHFYIMENMSNIGFSEVVVKDKGTGQEKGKTITHNGSTPKDNKKDKE